MKRNILTAAVAGALSATILLGGAVAQGNGQRNGNGPAGPRAGRGPGGGICTGMGPGGGMRYGAGGWWNRVTPKTPQQQQLVSQAKALHEQIRQANWYLYNLQRQNAPANQIAAKQQQIASLRTHLKQLTQNNQRLLQEMGLPAGAGVCDGTGPKGPGYGRGGGNGMGRGVGRGAGRGMRDGTGPNPNCPLKAQ